MPKAFRRFLKKLPKKIQTLKYSFREFLSSKIWNSCYDQQFFNFYIFNKT